MRRGLRRPTGLPARRQIRADGARLLGGRMREEEPPRGLHQGALLLRLDPADHAGDGGLMEHDDMDLKRHFAGC